MYIWHLAVNDPVTTKRGVNLSLKSTVKNKNTPAWTWTNTRWTSSRRSCGILPCALFGRGEDVAASPPPWLPPPPPPPPPARGASRLLSPPSVRIQTSARASERDPKGGQQRKGTKKSTPWKKPAVEHHILTPSFQPVKSLQYYTYESLTLSFARSGLSVSVSMSLCGAPLTCTSSTEENKTTRSTCTWEQSISTSSSKHKNPTLLSPDSLFNTDDVQKSNECYHCLSRMGWADK